MRKIFDIGPDGRIDGLRVIGFHGEVDFAQTPARREPVFADAEGRLIGLEGGPFDAKAVWGRVGQHVDSNPPPGIFTRWARPYAASRASLAVILGETELRHAKELIAARREGEDGQTSAFLSWLNSEMKEPGPSTAQRLDSGVVWYCGVAEAASLYRVISRVAEQHMLRASNASDEHTLYQSSWWLTRAAMDDSDRYFAAVGLELSERRMAKAYLKATFRKRPPEEIEAELKHARGVFEQRRANLSHERSIETPGVELNDPVRIPIAASARLDSGPFGRSRSLVRRPFVVPAPGRAA